MPECDPDEQSIHARLMLRSLTEDGEFARLFLQGMPTHLNHWMSACLQAAIAAGRCLRRAGSTRFGVLVYASSGRDGQDLFVADDSGA